MHHDSSVRATWVRVTRLIRMCDRANPYDICATWFIRMYLRHDLFVSTYNSGLPHSWLFHICDMTRSYVWYDSFMTHAYVRHDSFMTHSYVWHDWLISVTWLTHDSCICGDSPSSDAGWERECVCVRERERQRDRDSAWGRCTGRLHIWFKQMISFLR